MHTGSEHPTSTPSAVTSEPVAADVHAQGPHLTSRVLIYLRERLAAVPPAPGGSRSTRPVHPPGSARPLQTGREKST